MCMLLAHIIIQKMINSIFWTSIPLGMVVMFPWEHREAVETGFSSTRACARELAPAQHMQRRLPLSDRLAATTASASSSLSTVLRSQSVAWKLVANGPWNSNYTPHKVIKPKLLFCEKGPKSWHLHHQGRPCIMRCPCLSPERRTWPMSSELTMQLFCSIIYK